MRDEQTLFTRDVMDEMDGRPNIRMRLVFAAIAALCFLVMAASLSYADYMCTDCHGTAQHAPDCVPSCSTCHGFPPVDTNGLVHSYASQGVPTSTGATSAGAHAKHVITYGFVCDVCHTGGMKQGIGIVGNNKIQIGFNIPLYGGTFSVGGSYDGHPLNTPYSYEAGNPATYVTTSGSRTCSNIYCHSDGTYVSTGVLPAKTSPAWDTSSVPLSCNSCHGDPGDSSGRPSYANQVNGTKANSHLASGHLRTCNFCHYGTTRDGSSIQAPANHVNGGYDLQPDMTQSYNGSPVNFTYSYDATGGTCSAVSCHGGLALKWGHAISSDCASCHTDIVQSGSNQNHHAGECTSCHGTSTWPLHQGVTKACVDCHTTFSISKLKHPLDPGKTPDTCERCHESTGNYPGVKPGDIDSACGQCHSLSNAASHSAPYISTADLMPFASNMHGAGVVGGPVSPVPVNPPSPGCDSALLADGALGNGSNPTTCTTSADIMSCPGTMATTFALTDTTTQAHTLFISWGDGSPISSSPLTHAYSSPGTYNITQTVKNACGYGSQRYYVANVSGGPAGKGTLVISASGTGGFSLSYNVKDGSISVTNGPISVGQSKNIILDSKNYTVDISYQAVTPLTDPLTYHSCTTPAGGTLSSDHSAVRGIPVTVNVGAATVLQLTGCNN